MFLPNKIWTCAPSKGYRQVWQNGGFTPWWAHVDMNQHFKINKHIHFALLYISHPLFSFSTANQFSLLSEGKGLWCPVPLSPQKCRLLSLLQTQTVPPCDWSSTRNVSNRVWEKWIAHMDRAFRLDGYTVLQCTKTHQLLISGPSV